VGDVWVPARFDNVFLPRAIIFRRFYAIARLRESHRYPRNGVSAWDRVAPSE
jgi:hypothetical protein